MADQIQRPMGLQRSQALGQPQAQRQQRPSSNWDEIERATAEYRANNPRGGAERNTSFVGDVGTSLVTGALRLPGAVTGLGDIATAPLPGSRLVSKAADALGRVTGFTPGKFADERAAKYLSPETRAQQATVDQAFEDDGFFGGLKATASNPRALGVLATESLPATLAGGFIGAGLRGAAAAGSKLLPKALASPIAAGAVGEGALGAGFAMDQINPEVGEGRAVAAALGTGVATAGFAFAGGKLARRMGIGDPETILSGGKITLAKGEKRLRLLPRVMGGAVSEGVLQELPQGASEQMIANWAEGNDIFEGVDRAAVDSLMAGAATGGVFNLRGAAAFEDTIDATNPSAPSNNTGLINAEQGNLTSAYATLSQVAKGAKDSHPDLAADALKKMQQIRQEMVRRGESPTVVDEALSGVEYNQLFMDLKKQDALYDDNVDSDPRKSSKALIARKKLQAKMAKLEAQWPELPAGAAQIDYNTLIDTNHQLNAQLKKAVKKRDGKSAAQLRSALGANRDALNEMRGEWLLEYTGDKPDPKSAIKTEAPVSKSEEAAATTEAQLSPTEKSLKAQWANGDFGEPGGRIFNKNGKMGATASKYLSSLLSMSPQALLDAQDTLEGSDSAASVWKSHILEDVVNSERAEELQVFEQERTERMGRPVDMAEVANLLATTPLTKTQRDRLGNVSALDALRGQGVTDLAAQEGKNRSSIDETIEQVRTRLTKALQKSRPNLTIEDAKVQLRALLGPSPIERVAAKRAEEKAARKLRLEEKAAEKAARAATVAAAQGSAVAAVDVLGTDAGLAEGATITTFPPQASPAEKPKRETRGLKSAPTVSREGNVFDGEAGTPLALLIAEHEAAQEAGVDPDQLAVMQDEIEFLQGQEDQQVISDTEDADANTLTGSVELIGTADAPGGSGIVRGPSGSQDTNKKDGAASFSGFLSQVPLNPLREVIEAELKEPGLTIAETEDLDAQLAVVKQEERDLIKSIAEISELLDTLQSARMDTKRTLKRAVALQDLVPRYQESAHFQLQKAVWGVGAAGSSDRAGFTLGVPELTWDMVASDGHLLNLWQIETQEMFTALGITEGNLIELISQSSPEDKDRIKRRMIDGINLVAGRAVQDGDIRLNQETIDSTQQDLISLEDDIAETRGILESRREPITDALEKFAEGREIAQDAVDLAKDDVGDALGKAEKKVANAALKKARETLKAEDAKLRKVFQLSESVLNPPKKKKARALKAPAAPLDPVAAAAQAEQEAADFLAANPEVVDDDQFGAPADVLAGAQEIEGSSSPDDFLTDSDGYGYDDYSEDALYSKADMTRRDFVALIAKASVVATGSAAGIQGYRNPGPALGRALAVSEEAFLQSVPGNVQKILSEENGPGDGTLLRALQAMLPTAPAQLKPLIRQLIPLLPAESTVKVDDTSDINAHGSVTWDLGVPSMNLFTKPLPDGGPRHGLSYSTILHETLHTVVLGRYKTLNVGMATSNFELLGMPKPKAEAALQQFRKVFSEFRLMVNQNTSKEDNGVSIREAASNPDEFFVRALTDPVLQQFMGENKYNGRTLYARFKDWVKFSLFQMSREGQDASWLDAALLSANDLLNVMGEDPADMKFVQAQKAYRSRSEVVHSRIFYQDDPLVNAVADSLVDTMSANTRYGLKTVKKYTRKLGQLFMFTQDFADYAKKILPGVDTWYGIVSTLMSERNELDTLIQRVIDPVAKFSNARRKQLNTFLMDSTKAEKWGFDPVAAGIPGAMADDVDRQLQNQFEQLDKTQQDVAVAMFKRAVLMRVDMNKAIYNNMEAAFDEQLERLTDPEAIELLEVKKETALDVIEERMAESKPAYLPLRRFGKYALVHKSQELMDAFAAGDTGLSDSLKEDAAHYTVQFFESHKQGQQAEDSMRDLKGGDGDVEFFERARFASSGEFMPFSLMEGMRARLRSEEFSIDETGTEVRNANVAGMSHALQELYISALNEDSARKSELKRMNVEGADEDMVRAFVTHSSSMSNTIASLKINQEAQVAMQEMRDAARDGTGNKDRKNEILNEVEERQRVATNPNSSPFTDRIMGTTSIWMLLTSPAYYMQNVTQPFMLTLPWLGGEYGMAKSMGKLMRAYKTVGKAWVPAIDGDLTEINEQTVPDEGIRNLFLKLQGKGLMDIGIAADLGSFKNPNGVVGATVNDVHRKMLHAVRTVELFNRGISAVAAYQLELDRSKGDVAKATQVAVDVVGRTQFDYGSANQPRIFDVLPAGKVIGQFRKFQLGQIAILARAIHGSFKGASDVERGIARKQLTYILGMHGAVGGLMGLPAANVVSFVLAHALGDEDEPDDLELRMRRAIGDKAVADLILKGLPTMAGIDISSRLGMGQTTSIMPFTDIELSRDGAAVAIAGLLGPSAALAGQVLDGAGMIMEGNTLLGTAQMLPRVFRDSLRAYSYATEGVTRRNATRDVVIDKDDLTWLDIGMQGLGWPTQSLSERHEINNWLTLTEEHFNGRAGELRGEFVKKGADRGRIMREFRDLQNTRRKFGFSTQKMSTLTDEITQKRKREQDTVRGVPVRKSNRRFVEDIIK